MSNRCKSVAIAGSTGSIGTQALEVIGRNSDRFSVYALAANKSVDELIQQAQLFKPKVVAIADDKSATELRNRLPSSIEVRGGDEALASIVAGADITLNAVVGFAGLAVTMAALNQGKRLALANKESLIAAGPLVQTARRSEGAELLPVDSEHGAIHQCLRSTTNDGSANIEKVAKLVLTASGGPFRGRTVAELQSVTVDEALAHPTWKMGPKISIDSSTLFNKGLEVIEAHELFGIDYSQIEVTVHPQSIVHSAVEFTDGSTIAQLSRPDMRLPIGYALGHPERLVTPFGGLDWQKLENLSFEPVDRNTFKCLDLAYAAGKAGDSAPACLNAANEVAVAAFLSGSISWIAIASIIEETLAAHDVSRMDSIDDVIEVDKAARRFADQVVKRLLERDLLSTND